MLTPLPVHRRSTSCAANNATCQSITNRLLKRDFNEVVSMAASAFATTVAFQSIIEFEVRCVPRGS